MEIVLANQTMVVDLPKDTHWKIESGKWCWTYNPADFPHHADGRRESSHGNRRGAAKPGRCSEKQQSGSDASRGDGGSQAAGDGLE